MYSAFGVDHGYEEVEKGIGSAVRGLFGGGKKVAQAGRHVGEASPMYDSLAAKTGMRSGGAHRAPGSHRGTLKAKSFNPFGGGGKRRAV
jgi:hypothetical protein